MIIERTEYEIVIKLSPDISEESLQDLANYGKYLELASKSKATQQDVDDLVTEVKKGRWEETKAKLNL